MRATNYHMTTVHLSCYHVSVFLVCGFKKIAPCKLDLTIGHWPGSASSVGLVTVAAAFVWWQWSSGDCREEEGYEKKVQHKEAPKFHQGCPCCHVARGTSFFVKYVFVHMFVLLCIFQWFACVHCCISHSTIQFTLFFKANVGCPNRPVPFPGSTRPSCQKNRTWNNTDHARTDYSFFNGVCHTFKATVYQRCLWFDPCASKVRP